MAYTPKYNLFITDDGSTSFREWLLAMSGTNNSNMLKIEAALEEKADLDADIDGGEF